MNLLAMTKDSSPKMPSKLETITLKVYIHCAGCRRKVSKIINGLDGVQSITIDGEAGKVTVVGALDAKTVIQRLARHGKHAQLWAGGGGSGTKVPAVTKLPGIDSRLVTQLNSKSDKSSDSNSNKSSNSDSNNRGSVNHKNNKTKIKDKNAIDGSRDSNAENDAEETGVINKRKNENDISGSGSAGGHKKGGKKGDLVNVEMSELPSPLLKNFNGISLKDNMNDSYGNTNAASAAASRYFPQDNVQATYSLQTAEYATQLFSDENANNCIIM